MRSVFRRSVGVGGRGEDGIGSAATTASPTTPRSRTCYRRTPSDRSALLTRRSWRGQDSPAEKAILIYGFDYPTDRLSQRSMRLNGSRRSAWILGHGSRSRSMISLIQCTLAEPVRLGGARGRTGHVGERRDPRLCELTPRGTAQDGRRSGHVRISVLARPGAGSYARRRAGRWREAGRGEASSTP